MKESEKISLSFIEQHKAEIDALSEEDRNVLNHVLLDSHRFYYNNKPKYRVEIKPQIITCLSEFARENYGSVINLIVPQDFRNDFYRVLDNFNKYQYAESSYRRSYRCRSYNAFGYRIFPLMYDYFLLGACGVRVGGMSDYITGKLDTDKMNILRYIKYPDNIIAARIDANDEELTELINDMAESDNNTNILTNAVIIIRSVIKSANSELHRLICRLLVAAQLSEGLRQAICESADCGTAEAFIMIVNTIKEHNLIRFPAVKRAVATWTGICRENKPDRLAEKLLDDIIYVLQSRENCLEYIATSDAVHIYSGLWGLSFYDIQSAVDVIVELVISKESKPCSMVQLLTVGYFCNDVEIKKLTSELAAIVVESYPLDFRLFAVFLSMYPYHVNFTYHGEAKVEEIPAAFAKDKLRAERHCRILMDMYNAMPKKKIVYEEVLFPWYSVQVSKSDILFSLLGVACVLNDDKILDFIALHLSDLENRAYVLGIIGSRLATPTQREVLINSVADKESYTRRKAVELLGNIAITESEYLKLEGFAKYKTGDLRAGVITLLKKRSPQELNKSMLRMISNSDENVRLAALDLMAYAIEQYNEYDFSETVKMAAAIDNPSDREKILINKIVSPQTGVELSAENGYGIYDTSATIATVDSEPDVGIVHDYFSVSRESLTEMHLALLKIVDDNANLVYTGFDGSERLLGNMGYISKQRVAENSDPVMPFHELWQNFYHESITTAQRFWAFFLTSVCYATDTFSAEEEAVYNNCLHSLFGNLFDYDYYAELTKTDERFGNRAYRSFINCILSFIMGEFNLSLPTDVSDNVILFIIRRFSDDDLLLGNPNNFNRTFIDNSIVRLFYNDICINNSDDFERTFRIFNELNMRKVGITTRHHNYSSLDNIFDFSYYLLALTKGIINEDMMYKYIFEVIGLRHGIHRLSCMHRSTVFVRDRDKIAMMLKAEGIEFDYKTIPENSNLYRLIDKLLTTLTEMIIEVELKRGDSETVFSDAVTSIGSIFGINRLIDILKALGNETFANSSYYSTNQISKKQSLCHLLKVCQPDKNDNVQRLSEYLKTTKISDDRLIETALYAPQWIDIIADYLKIDGFKSGCYYFMAHTAEEISLKCHAIIAKYTPFSKEELNGGCFDVKWFNEVYSTLGEKKFNKIYKAAKYISSSNMHTRARKYADAALGKLDIAETKAIIEEKRNKDYLMSLAVIPSKDKSDILDRYEFIQKFLKESKKFGAQRRASEASAVQYAMKNLAVTAGYSDETRLTLSMETELVRCSRKYFEKNRIAEYDVWIEVDVLGKASLMFEKNGKKLKSAPTAIKKTEEFLSVKEFCDKLKQQYRRTVSMFELAMEEREEFSFEELVTLCENPVTKAITQNLVFIKADDSLTSGLIVDGGLVDQSGELHPVKGSTLLKVAHPYDLYKNKSWHDYQQLFLSMSKNEKRVQPFRQVFRELYVKLDEELEKLDSLMFAGNQVQPKRTVAALQSRKWIADYENGLQKVYYKDNIIASIYAVADWFSPNDIEAPILEGVYFTNRNNYLSVKLKDVPDVIYSEVMRDVDLAVSVAHAGGVDPEASHSTVEMRKVIIEFNLKLFGIKNVTLEKNHALIEGKHGKYSIHLGSGVIHKFGSHVINVVPVSNGSKSKLFLPFIDDDPKTAEILTKILTFAKDDKIKDPYILKQLK